MIILKYVPLILGLAVTAFYFFAADSRDNRAGAALRWITALVPTAMVVFLFSLFLGQHYEYKYVFENSSRDLPLIYRISALWAGQEGTFLLWYWLTALLLVVMIRLENLERMTYAAIGFVLAIIGVFLVISYPFAPLPADVLADLTEQIRQGLVPAEFLKGAVPADGAGLNPVLRNEWMAIHPPLIFIGYALAAAPFALAVAGVSRKDLSLWTRRGRVWAAAAWAFLGAGIFCGSYWAYIILGWGGFWAWDPVENASLLPWIVLAALSHGLVLQGGSRRRFALWNVITACGAMFMVLLTTFLTRSGAMAEFSVHSFGKSPLFLPILISMGVFAVFSIENFIQASRFLKHEPARTGPPAWAPRLLSWTVFMLAILLGFVTVGTLFPFISKIDFFSKLPLLGRLFTGNAAAVDAAYYNKTTFLTMTIIGALLLVCPFLFVKAVQGLKDRMRHVFAVSGALLGALLISLAGVQGRGAFVVAACYVLGALAGALVCVNLANVYHFSKLKRWSLVGYIIHTGVGLMILGVITSTTGSKSAHLDLPQGQPVQSKLGEFTFTRVQIDEKTRAAIAMIDVRTKNSVRTVMVRFPEQSSGMSPRPAIISGAGGDLYIKPESLDAGSEMAQMQQQQSGMPSMERPPLPKGAVSVTHGKPVRAGSCDLTLKEWDITPEMMEKGNVGVVITADCGGKKADITVPYNAMNRDYKKQEAATLADGTKIRVVTINVQKQTPAAEFAVFDVAPAGKGGKKGRSALPLDNGRIYGNAPGLKPGIILASLTTAQAPPAPPPAPGAPPAAEQKTPPPGMQMPPSDMEMPPQGKMPEGHDMPPSDMEMPEGHGQMPPTGMEGMGGMGGGMPPGHGGMGMGAGAPKAAFARITVETKPFIALLWIGMLLVTAGALAAAFRKSPGRADAADAEKQ